MAARLETAEMHGRPGGRRPIRALRPPSGWNAVGCWVYCLHGIR